MHGLKRISDVSQSESQPVDLPVLGRERGTPGQSPRRSTRGRWRALTLTLVYVAMLVHILHWWIAGRTLSPVEPSEAMQTLEQGLVNAGFVFFALAILSTLVLGRWFCGWGCHIVALQDLCTWLLKRAGIRPRPFRSRLLVFVPLLAALYMFVWPTVRRIWHAEPAPVFVAHFLTDDYWATFPGVTVSLLTFLVCGFLCVVLLGNKGFCTYGCPYGGFFGVADRVAPGRIRVTDDCSGCGHCTAVCTSNVRVHEEVRQYGMVVDTGCMKCTDCVSVCPQQALYFGFGRPALASGRSRAPRRRLAPQYSWPEELILAGVFAVALYAFRGLYDAIPFLLALGLAAICAFLLLQAVRLAYVPAAQLRGVRLKLNGRLTHTGRLYGTGALLLVAFVGHSALVQYHAREGARLLSQARTMQASGSAATHTAVADISRAALAHLSWVNRYGLMTTPRYEARLGSLHLLLGQSGAAHRHFARALELEPDYAIARYKLAESLAQQGELAAAVQELIRTLRDDPSLADARRDLISAARRIDALPTAVNALAAIVERTPHDSAVRLDLAVVLAELGRAQAAESEIRYVLADDPDDAEAHFRLGLLLADRGDASAAVSALERAVALDPKAPHKRLALGCIASSAGQNDLALAQLTAARRLAPLNAEILRTWAAHAVRTGADETAMATLEPDGLSSAETHYARAFLHAAAGHSQAAKAAYEEALQHRPDLSAP